MPEIGGSRIEEVRSSQRAMREFSRRLLAARPQTIVVISPHSPLDPNDFTARAEADLRGDFRDFYARHVKLNFPNDREMIEAIKRAAASEGVRLKELARECPLDHGAMVPLYYLGQSGWRGPVVVIGFTHRLTEDHLAFGQAVETAARALDRRVALIASGDLSHRLIEDGPYEYEPTAHLFDEQIVEAIKQGDARRITQIDQDLRLRAGECGYRSILVALGSVRENLRDHQVLSYEGPFGVGYLVAVLFDENETA